jgi:hypothetical protein
MRLAVGCALMLTLAAESARATPPPSDGCSGPSIVLEPPLSHRRPWREAAGDTEKRVAELTDVDACARLEVEQKAGAVHVRALAADGRSVVRDLSDPSELEPTVVALLVLPPSARSDLGDADDSETATTEAVVSAAKTKQATVQTSAQVKPVVPEPKPTLALAANNGRDTTTASLGSASGRERTRGVEVMLAGSGRAAGYLMGPGASALVDWQLGRWLLGATAHAEQVTGPSNAAGRFSALRSASLGAIFGRRLVARPFYLDAAIEAPVLAVTTSQWTSQNVVTQPGTTVPGESDDAGQTESGSDDTTTTPPTSTTQTRTQNTPPSLDLRAGALVRTVVPLAGRFGALLQGDAEHSLGLIKQPKVSGQPAPLGWNFGVSLGVFWSPE